MKYIIIAIALILTSGNAIGQGMINDIMVVETVSIDLNTVHQKILTKYNNTLKEEKADMDKDLDKIDKEYRDEVSKFIENYTAELEVGEEQMVTNLKQITVTKVSSLSMTHRTEKKNRVQDFLNKMQIAKRRLPMFLREDASTKVKDLSSSYFDKITDDYTAHLNTVKAFEDQEHLIITEEASLIEN